MSFITILSGQSFSQAFVAHRAPCSTKASIGRFNLSQHHQTIYEHQPTKDSTRARYSYRSIAADINTAHYTTNDPCPLSPSHPGPQTKTEPPRADACQHKRRSSPSFARPRNQKRVIASAFFFRIFFFRGSNFRRLSQSYGIIPIQSRLYH